MSMKKTGFIWVNSLSIRVKLHGDCLMWTEIRINDFYILTKTLLRERGNGGSF